MCEDFFFSRLLSGTPEKVARLVRALLEGVRRECPVRDEEFTYLHTITQTTDSIDDSF